MYVVTAIFQVEARDADAFLARVRRQAADSLAAEPACHRFDVCIDPSRPGRVLLYELYDDRAAFDAHLESPHFRAFDGDIADMVTAKEVQTWTRVEGSAQ
jgi:quinol monooxygenase YgiN